MPFTYSIQDRIVHVAWNGTVTPDDLKSFGEEMPKVGRSLGFAPDVLHTFEAVTGYSFQPIAAYSFSVLQKRVAIPNPVRAAIIATAADGKALARVFKALNRTRNLEMRVFDDEKAARDWIAAKSPAGG